MLNKLLKTMGVLYVTAAKKIRKKDGRVPKKEDLVNNNNVVYSAISENELVIVFENGFVLYQTDLYNEKVRSTVFPLGWVLDKFIEIMDVDAKQFTNLSSEFVLAMVGDQRVQENIARNLPEFDVDYDFTSFASDENVEEEVVENIVREEIYQILANGIKKLTKTEAHVLDLRYFFNLTQVEVAKRLGESRSNVQYFERKALEKIRMEFRAVGYM